MSLLLRLERQIETLVEGFFASFGRDRIHPVEIARRLFREMDGGAVAGLSTTMVPNDYRVFLNPRDFAPYASFAGPLVRQLEEALQEHARELGARLAGPLRIVLEARDEVTPGQIYAEAKLTPLSDAAGAAADAPAAAAGPAGDTRVYRRQPGAARLRIQAGPPGTAGREFALDRPVLTIGRRAHQDIVLADPSVSRDHARIETNADGITVVDLASTNGTMVNGRPIGTSRVALHPGDRIQIGTVLLELLGGP